VAAASYEAQRFGVRSAMPSTIVMRKCADLVFVPPRFDVYRAVLQEIHAIFTEYTPLVEPLSLDEAYLDVTDYLRGGMTARTTAKDIRKRIHDETALTASAGISYNKFLRLGPSKTKRAVRHHGRRRGSLVHLARRHRSGAMKPRHRQVRTDLACGDLCRSTRS
jgi:nucleotidyltransferase/DNA polymerase involved in DNA repair